jgi:carbonic anhydrase
MTKTTAQIAALALSSLMTLGVVAGMNGLATSQYAVADSLAMAQYGQQHVAVQHVIVIGHRA